MSNISKSLNLANKRLRVIRAKQKTNKYIYWFLITVQLFLNIAVLVLASVALYILFNENVSDSTEILMATLTSAAIIFIFIINIVSIVYRNSMKWKVYKKAMDKVQLEYFKFNTKQSPYSGKTAKTKLETNLNEIMKYAVMKKKNKESISKEILRSLAGGEEDA